MGGDIVCDSDPGKGSKFSFDVHLKKLPDSDFIGELDETTSHFLSGLKVLVIDDNEAVRDIIKAQAIRLGLVPHLASSAAEAISMLQSADTIEPYQIVIMDYRLPEITGLEASRRIRHNSGLSNIPKIVMVTAAKSLLDHEPRELLSNIDDVLDKPVNISLLLNAISNALGLEQVSERMRPHQSLNEITSEDLKPIRGARILLVEDDKINQQVALGFLKPGKFQVDVANNGLEALEKLEAHDYDCVLMDLHMPEMDGYQATIRIRSNDKWQDMPVLAMTADVMAEDRQRVSEVGMNDHIAKPVQPALLNAALLKWIPHQEREIVEPDSDDTEDMDDGSTTALPFRLRGCDLSKALINVAGDRALLRKLLIDFEEQHRESHMIAWDAMERVETGRALRIFHTLKSIAGTLGASELQKVCAQIEGDLKRAHLEDAKEHYQGFFELFEPLIHDLSEWTSTVIAEQAADNTATDSAISAEEISTRLKNIRAMLEEFSPEAESAAAELIGKVPGMEDELEKLCKFTGNFEFDKAQEIIEHIRVQL